MAGFGAAVNTGGVGRGDTVAVFGCGGVGDAAIAASALAGARTIVAVDIDARKLEWARRFGATHTVDAGAGDPVEAIKDLTDGFGADVVIEAVGPARDLPPGLLRPGPGRDPGPGRGARPVDDDRAADDRAVRPGWGPEVVVVRGLPARPAISRC